MCLFLVWESLNVASLTQDVALGVCAVDCCFEAALAKLLLRFSLSKGLVLVKDRQISASSWRLGEQSGRDVERDL